ncbi:MAG: UDP-N-acetylglucosamine 1-carboxyvinyltransferase [bacterium]
MEYFKVSGNNNLKGSVTISGNKNEALPVIAATLLAREPVTLKNVPDITDVRIMLKTIESVGASVKYKDRHTVNIDTSVIKGNPDPELCRRIRASILLVGPLLARTGNVVLPPPGGDVIGRRRIDTHFLGFEQLGALYSVEGRDYKVVAHELTGSEIFLDEPSVTATENIIMAAAAARGRSVIHNAATEPHVQQLCIFMNSIGAEISGIGTNRLEIKGVEKFGGAVHETAPDYIEAGSFIALAALSGSGVTIKKSGSRYMKKILQVFRKIGINTEIEGDDIYVPYHHKMKIVNDINNAIPKIDDGPWPAFPSDLMSIAIVAASASEGTVLFFEKMFESRLFFVDRLIDMGARIILCDPHRAVVTGPSQFTGTNLESPDIRAGMALLIAAVSAEGVSRIYNIQQIDRGYESIEKKLQRLGADIGRHKIGDD